MTVPINANLDTARAFMEAAKRDYPRRAASLDHIWNAALALIAQNKPVTKAAVGQLAHSAGGPAEQSIRNNKDYGRLVELLAEVNPIRSSRKVTNDAQILNAIGNEVDRSRIRQIIQERDRLKDKLTWMEKLLPEHLDGAGRTTPVPDRKALSSPPADPALSPAERQVIAKLLTADFWNECGAELKDTGVYVEGVFLLDALALHALRRLVHPTGDA